MGRAYNANIEWYHPMYHMDQARTTIEYLLSNGATLDRWRNLFVCSRWPQFLFELIDMIDYNSAPILQHVALQWKPKLVYEGVVRRNLDQINTIVPHSRIQLSPNPQHPRLDRIELRGFPITCLFNCEAPLVTNLTYLTLTSSGADHSLPEIHELLLANPRLESLTLRAEGDVLDPEVHELTELRVSLPHLRSFAIHARSNSFWGLRIVQMIDAPAVESLELGGGSDTFSDDAMPRMRTYLTTGIIDENDDPVLLLEEYFKTHDHMGTVNEPIYPRLTTLNIRRLRCDPWIILDLLRAYPSITSLQMSSKAIWTISSAPCVLPNLRILTLWDMVPETTERALGLRASAGLILDTLAVGTLYTNVSLDIPKETKVVGFQCFKTEEIDYETGHGPARSIDFSIDDPWPGHERVPRRVARPTFPSGY